MCAVNRVPDLPGSTPVCQRRPFGVAYKTANLSQISKTNTADRHRFLSRFVPRFLRTESGDASVRSDAPGFVRVNKLPRPRVGFYQDNPRALPGSA